MFRTRHNKLQRSRDSNQRQPIHSHQGKRLLVLLITFLVVGVVGYSFAVSRRTNATNSPRTTSHAGQASPSTLSTTTAPKATTPQACSRNTLDKNVLVSISQRHWWACTGSQQLYDSAVITGMENLPADLTPTGTYHVYAKQVNLYLNGSDSTGSWHDYVYYWMPFLSNQYGVYGFHDATWRPATAFGNISPYSSNASHGCVELPLTAAKWLYNWAPIGTTVTIES